MAEALASIEPEEQAAASREGGSLCPKDRRAFAHDCGMRMRPIGCPGRQIPLYKPGACTEASRNGQRACPKRPTSAAVLAGKG